MSDNIATCKQMLLYGLLCFVVGYGLGWFGGYIHKGFSSPSSEVGVGTVSAPIFCNDLCCDECAKEIQPEE